MSCGFGSAWDASVVILGTPGCVNPWINWRPAILLIRREGASLVLTGEGEVPLLDLPPVTPSVQASGECVSHHLLCLPGRVKARRSTGAG
jgi:hypothetical protein